MRNLFKTFLVMLMLSFSHAAIAGDSEDAFAVMQKGDFATALRLWTPLAEKGDVHAQFVLGQMFYEGLGVSVNYEEAFKWTALAATQGHRSAEGFLARMYRNGDGVAQSYKAAAKWYKSAAQQGVLDAQANLGVLYGNGTGVAQDFVKAYMWLSIAAKDGFVNSIQNRDKVAALMTPAQIEKAKKAASRCIKQKFKNCGY